MLTVTPLGHRATSARGDLQQGHRAAKSRLPACPRVSCGGLHRSHHPVFCSFSKSRLPPASVFGSLSLWRAPWLCSVLHGPPGAPGLCRASSMSLTPSLLLFQDCEECIQLEPTFSECLPGLSCPWALGRPCCGWELRPGCCLTPAVVCSQGLHTESSCTRGHEGLHEGHGRLPEGIGPGLEL